MGRLFWKFFLMFWLAQVFTMFGVGLAVWARLPIMPPPSAAINNTFQGSENSIKTLPDTSGNLHEMPSLRNLEDSNHGLLPPLLPVAAGSVVSLVFAALLAWYFARPIRTLHNAFVELASGNLKTRIGDSLGQRKDELVYLGQDFDHMASRLQGLMDAQQKLLHDISHEMRSPLARLQAVADLLQQQPERAAELIPRLERGTNRINQLVGELLTLARLDSGMTVQMDELVDLHELIEHIVEDSNYEAEAKQCTIRTSLSDQIEVKGNQELLFRALENVIRNAIYYTCSGSSIFISTKLSDGKWDISIEDKGPGVNSSELENIFKPFYRCKGSVPNGFGLGLAITQRIVIAHGGETRAVNRSPCGLRVEIILPAA